MRCAWVAVANLGFKEDVVAVGPRGSVAMRVTAAPPAQVIRLEDVVCEERLGGLLKSYRRAA